MSRFLERLAATARGERGVLKPEPGADHYRLAATTSPGLEPGVTPSGHTRAWGEAEQGDPLGSELRSEDERAAHAPASTARPQAPARRHAGETALPSPGDVPRATTGRDGSLRSRPGDVGQAVGQTDSAPSSRQVSAPAERRREPAPLLPDSAAARPVGSAARDVPAPARSEMSPGIDAAGPAEREPARVAGLRPVAELEPMLPLAIHDRFAPPAAQRSSETAGAAPEQQPMSWSMPVPESSTAAEGEALNINSRIGRIELSAPAEAAPPAAASSRNRREPMSLEAYLERRDARRGGRG